MIGFLTWLRAIFLSVLNGLAKAVALVVLLLAVLVIVSLARGDGLPANMVLALDLREPIDDSAAGATSLLTPRRATVMDVVLGLDAASRDTRVKGVVMRLGNGALSTAEAQEIGAAIGRFRAKGKFVIAQASAFFSAGLGDYLAATAANEIWMQPKSPFSPSGAGGGEIFLRGTFDKIHAEPQIAKRAEYKSAADMYMEKEMSPADREQLTALMNSVYDTAVTEMGTNRHIPRADVIAALEASPQFAEDARARKLIDRIGYDDEARAAAKAKAGAGAKSVKFTDYVKDATPKLGTANIAIVEAAGEIRDGTAKTSWLNASSGIASDDLSAAIDQAARDKNIKAIVLRVDSPGGSVTASDQILHAVKKAQKAGKPVVVSMGGVAASGGYYISLSANKIVAQPGTITGSIGVLTGKVSFGKTLELIGAKAETVGVGKNTLMDSPFQPFTPDQWANLNHQADVIYDDFTQKVAEGRKMPLAKVRDAARGRVWSGADAKARGLVDTLGGFWTAAQTAAGLASVPADGMTFGIYPRPTGLLGRLGALSGGLDASLGVLGRVESLLNLPALQAVFGQVSSLPDGGPGSAIQLKAAQLPRP
ncbi:MAG TPA: signal peptide peptidase SppA [Rhizomicrobium sp.]|nr:signal peptide peptidase SppA [Rhizomicrobium sp.]